MAQKLIAVHKQNHEGGLHVDAVTGYITTPPADRPEWADGLAVAQLAARVGWYEARLGASLPESVRSPVLIEVSDLDWIGVDPETGAELEVEADHEARMDTLSRLLSIDRQDFDGAKNFQDAILQSEIDDSYSTSPVDEATLEQVEGQPFGSVQKAING